MEKKEQVCPVCGCHVGVDAVTKKNALYCCHACATGSDCDCGCCEVTEQPAPEG